LGWEWSNTFGFGLSAALAVLLLIIGGVLIYFIGHSETDVDRIIKSAGAARFVLAFVAAFTAPLTEELVYRGVLYSAFKKKFGTTLGVIAVTLLFALVHVPQYKESLGVVMVILMLSFVLTMLRAKTGKILPCIIVHFIFNGLQALGIVFSPYLDKLSSEPVKQQAVIILKTFSF
jgi:membrane protease YdiL (CAAX protease family)